MGGRHKPLTETRSGGSKSFSGREPVKTKRKYKKRKTQYNKLDNYFCKLIIGSNQGKGNSSIQSPGEMTKTYKSQLDGNTVVSSALTNHLKTVMNRDDK